MTPFNKKVLVFAGLGVFGLGVSQVQGVEPMISFSAGTPVSAGNFNTNFSRLVAAIETLESQVSDLQDQLDAAESSVSYVRLPNGDQVPLRRKVLKGTKVSTDVVTIAHGLSGIAGQRRMIGCDVVSNYATNSQTIALNLTDGASTAKWCDLDNTNITIQFTTTSSIPNGGAFFAVIDYVDEPIE